MNILNSEPSTDGSVPSLAIIVPTYNEATSIGETVADIRATMTAHRVTYTLILVDDGSTDETPARLAELAAVEPTKTRVVTHARNLGLGRAIASGYAAAETTWVSWLPGDGQFSAMDLYELFAAHSLKDAVIGRVSMIARERADKLGRVIVSGTLRIIIRLLHPRMPSFNGIMVVRRDRVSAEGLVCRTGVVNMEILDRLRRTPSGREIGEREVKVLPRRSGHSKVANVRTTFIVLLDLWNLRIDYLLRPVDKYAGTESKGKGNFR